MLHPTRIFGIPDPHIHYIMYPHAKYLLYPSYMLIITILLFPCGIVIYYVEECEKCQTNCIIT